MSSLAPVLMLLAALGPILPLNAEDNCFNKGCVYSENAAACTKYGSDRYLSVPMNEAEQDAMVKWHNDFRRNVAKGLETRGKNNQPQPEAANMMQMYWDDELERSAQKMADQCETQVYNIVHDCYNCRSDSFGRFKNVGQNIAYEQFSASAENRFDFKTGGEKMWSDEVNSFDPSKIDVFRYEFATSHYTQLVWWNTRAVGCGRAIYGTSSPDLNIHVLICNYGPFGNIYEKQIYKEGKACSECPASTTCADGLCDIGAATKVEDKFGTDDTSYFAPKIQ